MKAVRLEFSRCDKIGALSRRQKPIRWLLTGLAETLDIEDLSWFSLRGDSSALDKVRSRVSQGSRPVVTVSTNCETGAATRVK